MSSDRCEREETDVDDLRLVTEFTARLWGIACEYLRVNASCESDGGKQKKMGREKASPLAIFDRRRLSEASPKSSTSPALRWTLLVILQTFCEVGEEPVRAAAAVTNSD